MTIENLKVGMTIKNYNELCGLLGVEPKPSNNTNGRKAHHKEFKRYFNYTKQGQNYIITEICEVVKKKVDNREKGGNAIYKEDFRRLMIYMLYNDKRENILISKGSLYQAMNLVNENYKLGKQDTKKLSKIIEVPKEYISDFYGENNKKIRETTERNLKSLRGESLLMYDIVTAVAIENIDIQYNELNTPIIENGHVLHNRNTEYRKATKKEKQTILICEAKAKAELGFSTDKEIFVHGAWGAYNKLVKEKLKEAKVNINFYYKAYEITWNNNKIEEEYSKLKQNEKYIASGNINDNMVNSINRSSKIRHTKAINANTTEKKEYIIRRIKLHASEEYTEYHDKLTKTLIDKEAMSLKGNFQNINRQQKEFDI